MEKTQKTVFINGPQCQLPSTFVIGGLKIIRSGSNRDFENFNFKTEQLNFSFQDVELKFAF